MLSPYIRQIREKIGHDLLLLPSVTILVFNEENKLLLVRHSNNNVWVAPGGMVEPDESPADAAVREVLEETGCKVELVHLVGVYGGPQFRINYQNGDKVGYVMTVYKAKILEGVPKGDGTETYEAAFFSRSEIESLSCGSWMPYILADAW